MQYSSNQPVWNKDTQTAAPAAYRGRTAVLDRRGPKVQDRAREVGVPVRYLGISPVFAETRAYAGPQTDWVIGPVTDLHDAVIPKAERTALVRLVEAGIEFPMIYIAHEVPKGRLAIPAADGEPMSRPTAVDRTEADTAVGPVPPPAAATALADRLGHRSQRLLQALAMTVPIAGAIVAAPFVLAGAAVAAIGALALDPIVFGVIPAGPPVPGQPAAWYILAQWDWPAAPELAP